MGFKNDFYGTSMIFLEDSLGILWDFHEVSLEFV